MIPSLTSSLKKEGYAINPQILNEDTIFLAREEATRLATECDSACIRNLRSKSTIFRQLPIAPEVIDLLGPNLQPVRSILFDKTPSQNWPVAWHQDLTIAVEEKKEIAGYGPWSIKDGVTHVQPPIQLLEMMVTIRLHLDDTPSGNGALEVIPGSYRSGRIPSNQIQLQSLGTSKTCECKAGDLLVMSPLILHSSRRSASPSHRRILHFEFAPPSALHPRLTWFERT